MPLLEGASALPLFADDDGKRPIVCQTTAELSGSLSPMEADGSARNKRTRHHWGVQTTADLSGLPASMPPLILAQGPTQVIVDPNNARKRSCSSSDSRTCGLNGACPTERTDVMRKSAPKATYVPPIEHSIFLIGGRKIQTSHNNVHIQLPPY